MQLISFISGRRGSGATSIAAELAASLRRTGTPHLLCAAGHGKPLRRLDGTANPEVAVLDVEGETIIRPGDADSELMSYLTASAVIVVPLCGGRMLPSSISDVVDAALRTARAAVSVSPKAKVLFLHNQRSLSRLSDELDRRLADALPELRIISVPESETVPLAAHSRISAVEGAAYHPATQQILSAINAIREAADLPRESTGVLRRQNNGQSSANAWAQPFYGTAGGSRNRLHQSHRR